jgi:homogentisate 1,2-dioxygenase
MSSTIIHKWDELELTKNAVHPELYQKIFLSPEDADQARIKANMILYERLEQNGAVLPHSHDVCEIICITRGSVQFYSEFGWREFSRYDTFIVPAGQVHSVVNIYEEASEQISFFIPVAENSNNVTFQTEILSGEKIEKLMALLKERTMAP